MIITQIKYWRLKPHVHEFIQEKQYKVCCRQQKMRKDFVQKFRLAVILYRQKKKYNNYTMTMFYFEDRSNFLIQRIIERNLKLKK